MDNIRPTQQNTYNQQNKNLNRGNSNKTKEHSGIIQSAFSGKENLPSLENHQVKHLEAEQALYKIGSRVLSTHMRSSNLKKVARDFAEGQTVVFPLQYHSRELHQVGDLQTGFDPTNQHQVEQWMVFYAKVCVIDADPDSKKFHRESNLGKDTFFMNALSKGAGYFKEFSKQEGLSIDAVAEAEEIAEVFARVQAKFQRTPQQVNEYEENRQITREVLSIMKSQHHHLEGPLGEGLHDRHLDFDTQNVAIGGQEIPISGSVQEYREAVFARIRTLLDHPGLTDMQAAEIVECACSRNLEAIMLNAVHKRHVENVPGQVRQDITIEEYITKPRISTIDIDRYDVILTSEMHCRTTIPPGNQGRNFKEEYFTVKVEMRVPKEALFNKTLAELSSEECQVSCQIVKG